MLQFARSQPRRRGCYRTGPPVRHTIPIEPRKRRTVNRQPLALGRALLPQSLNRIQNPQPIANAGDSHLLERILVKLKEDIAADVARLERVRMVAALDIREPARDLVVIPSAEKIVIFHAGGRVHEGLLSCRRGSG